MDKGQGLFTRGKSWTSIPDGLVGLRHVFPDNDYGVTTGVLTKQSGYDVECVLVQNQTGGTVTKGLAYKFDWSGSDALKAVSAVAAANEVADGIADEHLATTVPSNSYFWLVRRGPTEVTTANATEIAAGDPIMTAAGGKIVEALSAETGTVFGRMMAPTSAADTLYRAYVDFTNVRAGAAVPLLTNVTAATITLTRAAHGNHVITLNRAAGITVTLPAATGSGVCYTFYTGTTVTSNNNIIQVADASHIMQGTAWMAQDGGDTLVAFETSGTSDTMTMNGSTKGGIIGDRIDLIDVASNQFCVQAWLQGTGTEATPFSAAV